MSRAVMRCEFCNKMFECELNRERMGIRCPHCKHVNGTAALFISAHEMIKSGHLLLNELVSLCNELIPKIENPEDREDYHVVNSAFQLYSMRLLKVLRDLRADKCLVVLDDSFEDEIRSRVIDGEEIPGPEEIL